MSFKTTSAVSSENTVIENIQGLDIDTRLNTMISSNQVRLPLDGVNNDSITLPVF